MNNEIASLEHPNENLTKLVNKSSAWMGGIGYYHVVVGVLLVLFSLITLVAFFSLGVFLKNRPANELNLFSIVALCYFLFLLGNSVASIFMGLKLVKAANKFKEYIQSNLTSQFEEAMKNIYLFFLTSGLTIILSILFLIFCSFGRFAKIDTIMSNATKEGLSSEVEKIGVETDKIFQESAKYSSKQKD